MAGGLTISTLNDSSGVLAVRNGMTGIPKAWVNFNGLTYAIRSSFNVSSITRTSGGVYTISFSTSMPNANYVGVASIRYRDSAPIHVYMAYELSSYATSSIVISTFGITSGAAEDYETINVAILSS